MGRKVAFVVVAAGIVAAVLVILRRPPAPETAPVVPPIHEAPATPPETELPVTPPVTEQIVPTEDGAPVDVVRVRAGQVLARVNGVPIRLADLAPAGEGIGAELAMTTEEYAHRLNRAIETELILQAAAAQGVELDEAQQQELEQIEQQREQAIREAREQGMHWTSVTPEQIAFELKQRTAIGLQQNLIESAGGPPLRPTADQIRRYYDEHADEFPPLPEDPAQRELAWQHTTLEIRQRLEPVNRAEYLEAARKLMEELKAQAQIELSAPTP